MLKDSEITAGTGRLSANKLKPEDVNELVSVFRLIMAGLEERKEYKFQEKLEALDDSLLNDKSASQVAAVIIKLKGFGFGVAELTGQRGAGVKFKQIDRYIQVALFAFSKIYPIPAEFSLFELKRAILLGSYSTDSTDGVSMPASGSVCSSRI